MSGPAADPVRDGLFFVVGHHRGGTTLLQAMLSSHSRLTVPPETQFFLEVWPRRERLGPLAEAAGRARALAFLGSADCSARDLGVPGDAVAAELPAGEADYADLFVALLGAWARRRGKPRVGDKSPGHIHQVPLLARLYPRARFVAVLRDPRAVVASELQAEWGARSVDQIARRWGRVVDAHRRLEAALPPERYHGLRYEDLVNRPEAALRELCGFLEEPFEPGMLRYWERPPEERGFHASESWKQRTLSPLEPARLDAWRRQLTPVQVALVEAAVGERLAALGYAAHPGAAALGGPAGLWQRLRDRLPWALEVASGAARRKRGPRRPRA